MVLGEVGKLPVEILIKQRVLNYWFKLITCKNEAKLDVIMYNVLFNLYNIDDTDRNI